MSLPETYHSEANDGPFQACTSCHQSLQSLRTGYQIVKCWHHHEVIYEYALCQPCNGVLLGKFSTESRERLAEFHRERLQSGYGPSRCATCAAPAAEISTGEYSITGLFLAQHLEQEVLVCGRCTQEMQSLLSTHTRGVWDQFLAEKFPAPPADVIVPEPVCL